MPKTMSLRFSSKRRGTISVPTIYLSGNLSSQPLIPRLLFQEVVLLFYVEHFNELLGYFLGVHAVSHDVLSENGLFRPMYIEETYTGLSLFLYQWQKGYKNKAILNFFILGSILKLQRNHCTL